jgi:hypothetical protein
MNISLAMFDDCDESELTAIEVSAKAELETAATAACKDWAQKGDWGENGAVVHVHWEVVGVDGSTAHELVGESGDVDVEIEPDHASLIRRCGGADHKTEDGRCGSDPASHDWTSAGEDGCSDNPGVFALGGTKIEYNTHCRRCGLHRRIINPGEARNRDDHAVYEYHMLTDDAISQHRNEGSMDSDLD